MPPTMLMKIVDASKLDVQVFADGLHIGDQVLRGVIA